MLIFDCEIQKRVGFSPQWKFDSPFIQVCLHHFDHQKGEKSFRFYENYPSLKFREKARGEGISSMLGSLYISSLAK